MENQEFNGEAVENQEGMEVPATNSNAVVDGDEKVEKLPGAEGEAAEETEGDTLAPVEGTEAGADEDPAETEAEEKPVEEQGEVYSFENPMPVQIVEPVEEEYELEVYSLTGSYPGPISDTYLNYFRGIVQKLNWKEHYVVYRSGQYSYTMAYGEDVTLIGGVLTGPANTNIVNIYRNSSSSSSDWYVSRSRDRFTVSAGSLFIYSDLGMYPELKEGGTSLEFMALLFAVGFAVVYSVCHDIFDYIMEHVYRK